MIKSFKCKWGIRGGILVVVMIVFSVIISGCSGWKVGMKEPSPPPVPQSMIESSNKLPVGGAISYGRADADNEQLRAALAKVNEVLSDIKKSKKNKRMLVFTEPLRVKKGDTLEIVLSKLKVTFDPVHLKNIVFAEDTYFDSNVDLFEYIENKFNLFVEDDKSGIIISELKEKTYKAPFIENIVQSDLSNFLNHRDAYAVVHENMGTITVKDDVVGHRKIEDYIMNLKDLITSAYSYDIRIEEKGVNVASLSGEITPVTPANFGGGTMTILVKGGRILVSFRHALYPNVINFFIPKDGGTYSARENDTRVRISLKKEPIEWVEKIN